MKGRGCNIAGAMKKALLQVSLQGAQTLGQTHMMNDGEAEQCRTKLPFEVEEFLNQPYINREEDPLAMDVFKPVTEKGTELPVIVTIHGGGLVRGDRKVSRKFNRILAGHGYLVFSVEYRLVPRANCAQQLDDVCAGMDLIGRALVDFDVDFSRIFLIAGSAGAYLATYVTAMRRSVKLQEAIGYKPSKMVFKAVGLISGMFYTRKKDPIGLLLSDQFYGEKEYSSDFVEYMDPENPEILQNLPPAYLITSRGDFLNNYTLMFHDALKKAGKKSHLLYYGDKKLYHTFVTYSPYLEQSEDAIQKMLTWFEEQAALTAGLAEEKTTETAEAKEEKAPELAETKEEKAPESAEVKEEKTPELTEAREEKAPESAEVKEEKTQESAEPKKKKVTRPAKAREEETTEPAQKPARGRRKKTETGSNRS